MLKTIVLFIGLILYFGLWSLYFHNFMKRKTKVSKRSSVLFNASVTENGVPAREVFKTLEDAGIKPNYLGNNLEQG